MKEKERKNLSKKNLTSNIQPLTTTRGITLIALVITIIVMLILVAVTITMVINGGLFSYAGKAVGETKNAINEEQDLGNGRIKVGNTWYDTIDDYLSNTPSKNQGAGEEPEKIKPYDETPKDDANNGVLTANATFTDAGGIAIIPKGFKIVEGLNGSKSIAEGLVIEDKDGNQFVWIPVTGYTKDGEPDAHGLYESFKTVFTRGYWEYVAAEAWPNYTEPYNGYANEEKEYYEMMLSVQENRGFYIGRFEAGSTTPRIKFEEDGQTYKSNGTTKMVVKQNQYPYNLVGWGLTMNDYTSDVVDQNNKNQGKSAVALSKEMYEGKDVGVISTLCYGVQWDAMLNFINDSTHDVTNSVIWGNYRANTWKIRNPKASFYIASSGWTSFPSEGKSNSSSALLLTTGAGDVFSAKNIYDVAGNCYEWTMEAYPTDIRVIRGRLV